MSHLTTRVTYSKGLIKAPVAQLLSIVNMDAFTRFPNQQIRRKVFELIHGFIKGYSTSEGAQEEDGEVFMITLESCQSETLSIDMKCRMYSLCLHRMQLGYLKVETPEARHILGEKLNAIFTADISLKKAFVHFGLLLVIAMFPLWNT